MNHVKLSAWALLPSDKAGFIGGKSEADLSMDGWFEGNARVGIQPTGQVQCDHVSRAILVDGPDGGRDQATRRGRTAGSQQAVDEPITGAK